MMEEEAGQQFVGSGRVRDLMILRRRKLRPFSAANADGRNLPGRSAKTKGIPYGIEELYDRTLQLKTEVNTLKAENMKLKTKTKQIEGKLGKRQPEEQPFLLDSLKKQVADLKTQLELKDDDFVLLKKKLKFTKLAEMETELKVANDESIRLNRMLVEAMEELTKGVMPIDLQERFLKLKVEYKGLKREFFELTAYVKDNKPRSSFGYKYEPTKGKKSAAAIELRAENTALSQELQKLREKLLVPPKCPKCGVEVPSQLHTEVEEQTVQGKEESVLTKAWQALLDSSVKIPDFWMKLDPEMLGAVKPHTLIETLEMYGLQLSTDEVTTLFEVLGVTQGESVHKTVFEGVLEKYRPSLTDEQQKLIEHLKMKLQGLRMELGDVPSLLKLTEPQCAIDHFKERLETSLLRFKPELSKEIAEVCFLGYVHIPTDRLYTRISEHIGLIELLLPEKEAELDAELRSLYSGRSGDLISRLQPFDPRNDGYVTLGQFLDASRSMGISLPDYLQKYLKVLFYADRQELDQAPYDTFAQAFCVAGAQQ